MLKDQIFAVLFSLLLGSEPAQKDKPVEVKPVQTPIQISQPESIKGIYVGQNAYGVAGKIANVVHLLRNTEINTVVVDYKDDYGEIFSGETFKRIIHPFRAEKAFVICRIVTFKMVLRKDHPIPVRKELLLHSRSDGRDIWKGDKGKAVYLNPALPAVKEYIVSVAEEAIDDGCDELNFDYIRFPDGEGISNILLPVPNDPKSKWPYLRKVMREFEQFLAEGIRRKNASIFYSADIFGYAAMRGEPGIGQYVEDFVEFGFGVYGMFYPSHYNCNEFGVKDPNAHPYLVLYKSLSEQVKRLQSKGYRKARIISWVQGFDLANTYGCGGKINYADNVSMFREQTRAITSVRAEKAFKDFGIDDSWIVWNPAVYYNPDNFLPKKIKR